MTRRGVFLVMWLAALAPAFVGGGADVKAQDDKKPDLVVSAEQLTKDFVTDPKAAETKYKDKFLQIEGVVDSTNKVLWNGAVVFNGYKQDQKLRTGVLLMCTPALGEWENALGLSRGQKVKVRGKFFKFYTDKEAIVLGVMVMNCKFTELSPSTAITVTSEAIAKEFDQDAKAADKKYRISEVIVRGEVTKLEVSKKRFHIVYLKGQDKMNVAFEVEKKDFDSLERGQMAQLKGKYQHFSANEVVIGIAFLLPMKK